MNVDALTGHVYVIISICYGIYGHIPSNSAINSIINSLIYLASAAYYYWQA